MLVKEECQTEKPPVVMIVILFMGFASSTDVRVLEHITLDFTSSTNVQMLRYNVSDFTFSTNVKVLGYIAVERVSSALEDLCVTTPTSS